MSRGAEKQLLRFVLIRPGDRVAVALAGLVGGPCAAGTLQIMREIDAKIAAGPRSEAAQCLCCDRHVKRRFAIGAVVPLKGIGKAIGFVVCAKCSSGSAGMARAHKAVMHLLPYTSFMHPESGRA
jgi:hypothetical protein